ncbi:MAG: arylsulfatase A-like enzyme [Parasphingorhabdus sp.]|jgi:arylsulfatase A-like enzyme
MLGQVKFRAPDNDQTIHRLRASYLGLIKELDDNLGRLFNFLKKTNQWDDTLIILTSDHGEQMGEHWLINKLGFFDASYHIPLIIRDPSRAADVTRGCHLTSFTENVDIMPTLLDRLGIDIPTQCDGLSLMSLVNGAPEPEQWRREVHFEYDFRDVLDSAKEQSLGLTAHQCVLNVIRDHEYKYVHFTALPPLLYDLKKDPGEIKNVANDPIYRDVRLTYCERLLSWRMNHDERGLTEIILTPEGPKERKSALTQAHEKLGTITTEAVFLAESTNLVV